MSVLKSLEELDLTNNLLDENRIGIKKLTDFLKINTNRIPDVIQELKMILINKENTQDKKICFLNQWLFIEIT